MISFNKIAMGKIQANISNWILIYLKNLKLWKTEGWQNQPLLAIVPVKHTSIAYVSNMLSWLNGIELWTHSDLYTVAVWDVKVQQLRVKRTWFF